MRLISNQKLKATANNRLKNDCPLQCNKKHCDVCQFRNDKSESIPTVTTNTPSPEDTVEICIINPKQVSMVQSTQNYYYQPDP